MADIAPMPTIGGSAANLQNDVNSLAPLATTWSGAANGVPVAQNIHQSSYTAGPSFSSGLGSFFASTASSIGHIAASAVSYVAKSTAQMAEGAYHFPMTAYHAIGDDIQLHSINARIDQNNLALKTLGDQYNQGKISLDQYKQGMKAIQKSINDVSNQTRSVTARTAIDAKNLTNDTIAAGSAVITIMTAGVGDIPTLLAGKATADYFATDAADAFLANTVNTLNKVATNPEALSKLNPMFVKALEGSTAEVVARAAPNMVGKEIAKVAAVNLAIKYPLYYQAIEPTAKQLYTQLDQQKYGDAIRTVAFNAALVLSGGAIGRALDVIKGSSGILSKYAFGQSSFWDELSKYYDKGQSDGFVSAISDRIKGMSHADAKEFVHNLSAVEATNLNATGGDAVAAAQRLALYFKSQEGFQSLHDIQHADALDNMVEFAKAQRDASYTATKAGLGAVTVGRLDSRDLAGIASKLSSSQTAEQQLQTWESIKAANPNQAWANNDNLDTQIKGLINSHTDPARLSDAIKNIQASFRVEGFPKSMADSLAKRGYIPISPTNLQAPFKEGSGKLVTASYDKVALSARNTSNDFFLKATQPLPILGYLGDMLTRFGLSPQASTQRVYQLFHDQLSENLQRSQALSKYADNLVAQQKIIDASKTTGKFTKTELDTIRNNAPDTMIKKLSEYAKDPTRGGVTLNTAHIRFPITDLRQLTPKDIQAALGVSAGDAREVRGALMDSMLSTKMLATTGLGDALISANYKFNPIAAGYTRAQGALRFAWNPIFAAKLQYKTEVLAQAEAGGKFPTLLGTNWILSKVFPGKYAQLDAITNTLKDAGILEQNGIKRLTVTGEGVNDSGVMSANLTHGLLPGQERSIAALISTQADKVGMNVTDFIHNFPHEVADTVQTIAQYDRHNSVLNSPLMRTLNLAFFPLRFETKVATIMATNLAKTSAMTQFAVIKGLYNADNWLKSPEGQAWYSKNSDLLGLLKYFSPLSTMSTVAQLLGGRAGSVGAYGELGGLPFGWITQTLDASGLTHFGTEAPLVSSKTGEVVPAEVPTNVRGQLQLAIEDFIGGLYTYPGSTAGLPSKTGIDRSVVRAIMPGASKSDFNAVTPPITPEQEQYQKVVQQQNGTMLPPSAHPVPQPGLQPGIKMPATPTDATTPLSKKGSASGSAKKKTKAEMTPQLLPGQTTLGQLP